MNVSAKTPSVSLREPPPSGREALPWRSTTPNTPHRTVYRSAPLLFDLLGFIDILLTQKMYISHEKTNNNRLATNASAGTQLNIT